ncbi:hypothetical protein PMAYCL1PPCAC_18451 [Pristionchus mayeri]|uniref:Uncharacterized protein n=1 Tax=Pristionchus mayeri TaxID=1317129 RepID=A0AAN5I221_9BILA|nr:hypothetical protein PMAYCL1PPCAC_18451 [Pristionchus mayeri]
MSSRWYPGKKIITNVGREVLRGSRLLSTSAAPSFSPKTTVTTLPSGMRVATENTNMPTATIGVFIDAGSRYENEKNNGTAHFLEHMAFKGTSRRTRYDLELEVENMGAHLNAYTSREQTVYYAKCFAHDIERSTDILSDILIHSRLHKKDVEAERSVILREAEEVAQNLQEVVFDELHMAVFDGTPLSYTILGPEKNIKSITRDDLADYIKTHYKGNRMVIAASGGVDHSQVVELASKYFGQPPSSSGEEYVIKGKYVPCEKMLVEERMERVSGAICVEGVSWTHEDNLAMMVTNTILGEFDRSRGLGLNAPSEMQLKVASIEGVFSFQSFNTCYKDTGLNGIYYQTEPKALRPLMNAVVEGWRWMAYDVDAETVEKGKRSLLTNLMLMLDGSTPVTEDIGRQLIFYGRRIPMEELKARVEAITVDSLREVCQKRLLNCKLATMIVGPALKDIPSNEEIEAALSR